MRTLRLRFLVGALQSCVVGECSERWLASTSLNGGKKTMLLAVYQAPKTYSNLKALFTLLNVPGDLECVYACDLKVINMDTGLTSHSSRHPCPYCTSRATQWDPGASLWTIPMNAEQQHLWRITSGKKIENKYFFNCLNPPLLNSNLPILLLCRPPPLHLKLGIVNLLMHYLFSLHPYLEKEVAKTLRIVEKDYHGKSFEGRQCSKLISKCGTQAALIPVESLSIVNCLGLFEKVVEATFGHVLSPTYEEGISQFGFLSQQLCRRFIYL